MILSCLSLLDGGSWIPFGSSSQLIRPLSLRCAALRCSVLRCALQEGITWALRSGNNSVADWIFTLPYSRSDSINWLARSSVSVSVWEREKETVLHRTISSALLSALDARQ